MTPRLVVTRKQAGVVEWAATRPLVEPLTLRLPERPTMPCPECGGKGWWSRWRDDVGYRSVECNGCARGSVPIPEGTRVEVGWWAGLYLGQEDWRNEWRPVAFATLTEVHAALADGQPYRWYITLSDIEPAGEDQ